MRRVLALLCLFAHGAYAGMIPMPNQALKLPVAAAGGGGATYSADITEDFNCSNSASLNCDLTWVENSGDLSLTSNKAQTTDINAAFANNTTNMGSANHCSQAVVTLNGTSSNRIFGGPTVRDDGAGTFYRGDIRDDTGTADRVRIMEAAAYTELELVSAAYTVSQATPYTLRMCANGSNLELFVNGVSVLTTTDGTITSNLKTGFELRNNDSPNVNTIDDFEAGTFK